ncbi:MAG: NADPH-dependent 7-cyano-7-deazaguanine reductase QueF [Chlamydiota bacterium]|nr:NADPH-dependent 7-cyano-7-deazaguanine reductase QueF [Chlamydiota bacterium]
MTQHNHAEQSELGKKSAYITTYSPSLLYPIARKANRNTIGVPESLPFHGVDLWTAFELSWLNTKGKPVIAIADFAIPCTSEYIIESKSFKLYLNSFNQSKFSSIEEVQHIITKDVSAAVNEKADVKLYSVEEFSRHQIGSFEGTCIDNLDISTDTYTIAPSFLSSKNESIVEEKLCTHLLKSNCLVTHQPDWGSLYIHYKGKKINQEGLLKYIISFRSINEFGEQCIERIYMDLMRHCQPEKLTVYGRYTRRGGLDINPFRSNWEEPPQNTRLPRQ